MAGVTQTRTTGAVDRIDRGATALREEDHDRLGKIDKMRDNHDVQQEAEAVAMEGGTETGEGGERTP